MNQPLPLLVAFGAGIASFFAPCILPLIPAYLAFITGLSIDELKDSQEKIKNLKRILYETILFILGFSFVFVILGASITYLGGLISSYQKILQRVGGGLIILFGLYLTGLLKIREEGSSKDKARPSLWFFSDWVCFCPWLEPLRRTDTCFYPGLCCYPKDPISRDSSLGSLFPGPGGSLSINRLGH